MDVSTPTGPVLVTTSTTMHEAHGVTVVGGVAYVADGYSGIQVLDVSSPELPVIVGAVDTPGFALDVSLVGDHAIVADRGAGVQIVPAQCDAVVAVGPGGPASQHESALRLQAGLNPFSGGTRLIVDLPVAGPASLDVFDAGGRLVLTRDLDRLDAGRHAIEFDARDALGRPLAAGVWFVRLRTPRRSGETVRLVNIR